MPRKHHWKSIRRQLRQTMDHPLISRWGGRVVAGMVRAWMSTLEYKTCYEAAGCDPALADLSRRRMIYVFWHEYILYQLYLRGHCGVSMLLSQNRDAHFLSQAAYALGFGVVRGSSFQGALSGLRGLIRIARDQHLTITPDGPRGPRRRFAMGPIYLSSKLQMPLVAVGMGYDRPYRLSSWDHFAIPRPLSRARCLMSPPIQVPPNIPAAQLEEYRRYVESELARLTELAEAWAATAEPRAGQVVTRRAAAYRPSRRPARVAHPPNAPCHSPARVPTADGHLSDEFFPPNCTHVIDNERAYIKIEASRTSRPPRGDVEWINR